VISPIDGFISGAPARAGQVVSSGSPVAKIIGLHGVYFEAMVPETEIAKVKVGQTARIQVDAYKDRTYDGAVIAIRPQADDLGRQFAVRIAVSNGVGQLRPGMFARGQLVFDTMPNATLIPSDSVLSVGGESFVFVADGDKAKRVAVTVGLQKDGFVQVSGLSPSEKVVVAGKDKLTDGARLREDKPKRAAESKP
jgi:RND family efflux transporter MFP subunit